MRKKKNRRPRRKRGLPYVAADVRIEDAGPHPKGPIIGRHNPPVRRAKTLDGLGLEAYQAGYDRGYAEGVRRAKTLDGLESPPDTAVTPSK